MLQNSWKLRLKLLLGVENQAKTTGNTSVVGPETNEGQTENENAPITTRSWADVVRTTTSTTENRVPTTRNGAATKATNRSHSLRTIPTR